MAYAERRGNLWRARWRGPDGTLESKPGFTSKTAAEKYGRKQEAAIENNTYIDPRAGQIMLTDWVNEWYPAQDLEPTTLTTAARAPSVLVRSFKAVLLCLWRRRRQCSQPGALPRRRRCR